jgi:hypothetical protein
MIFFRALPYGNKWGTNAETEAVIKKELPFFVDWLLRSYVAPEEVIVNGRIGVEKYFDPLLLQISRQQAYSYHLAELIHAWIQVDEFWGRQESWAGTPTELLTALTMCEPTSAIARTWTQQSVSKSLNALARTDNSGVVQTENSREFTITKSKF